VGITKKTWQERGMILSTPSGQPNQLFPVPTALAPGQKTLDSKQLN